MVLTDFEDKLINLIDYRSQQRRIRDTSSDFEDSVAAIILHDIENIIEDRLQRLNIEWVTEILAIPHKRWMETRESRRRRRRY